MRKIPIILASILLLITCSIAQDVTIHDIQFTEDPSGDSPLDGQLVWTGGLVTAVNYTSQPIRYFVADRTGGLWSGVLVNDNANRFLSIGDSVHCQVEVQESSNQTRLHNIVVGSFTTVPAAGTVEPTPIATGEVDESTEGVLIEFTEALVTEVGSGFFMVDDGSGEARIGEGWSYAYEPLVGDTLSFTRGIVSASGSEYTVNPRDDLDFGFFSNRAPLISNVTHSPDIPTALEPVQITATITDDNSVQSAAVYYRFGDNGSFSSQSLFDDGLHGDGASGDNTYGGLIPAGIARTTAYFYIWAIDGDGAEGTSPADAPDETYNYFVRSAILGIWDLQYTGSRTGGASPYAGQTVTVTGICTGENFDGNGFFMCDPGGGEWAGIYVFSPPLTPARGDCVSVTAQVQEFFEVTEMSSVSSVTVLGQGTIPDPLFIRAEELPDSGEAYEGVLIRIDRCVCVNTEDFGAFRQYDVRDSTGTGTVLHDFFPEFIPALGDSFNFIVGCGHFHSAVGWMIAPRDDADIGYVDRRAPQISSASAVSEHKINIRFNERLSDEGIGDPANYTVVNNSLPEFPELTVSEARLFSNGRTIQVEVAEVLTDSQAFAITIHSASDLVGNDLEDDTISFSGYSPSQAIPIVEIYENYDAYNDSIETLRGVVNFVQDVTTTSGSRRISAYIQDESGRGYSLSQTGAASTFPGIQRGNLIQIKGIVNQFGGTIQLGSFNGDPNSSDIVVLSENEPLPEPVVVRTGDLRAQADIVRTSHDGYFGAGTWVRTTGTIYQVDENVGGGTNIFIDDGSGNLTIRVWDSMNLDSVVVDGQTYSLGDLVGVTVTIEGPSSTFSGDFQLLAGYAEDFISTGSQASPSLHIELEVPNRPFAPDIGQSVEIYINSTPTASLRLRVFNLRGQLVTTLVDKPAGGPNVISWDGRNQLKELVPLGTYILHAEAIKLGESESVIRPIVVGTKL